MRWYKTPIVMSGVLLLLFPDCHGGKPYERYPKVLRFDMIETPRGGPRPTSRSRAAGGQEWGGRVGGGPGAGQAVTEGVKTPVFSRLSSG